jgi:hypothetical protein
MTKTFFLNIEQNMFNTIHHLPICHYRYKLTTNTRQPFTMQHNHTSKL